MSDEADEIGVEFVDLTHKDDKSAEQFQEAEDEGTTTAYHIAKWVMKEFEPGFIIIGSPNMAIAPSGLLYPSEIGIVMNDKVGITKTTLANILDEISFQLGEDMLKIQNFVNRTKND